MMGSTSSLEILSRKETAMAKNPFVIMLLLLSLFCQGSVQSPSAKGVMVLLDLSESTRIPQMREAYTRAFGEILAKLAPGDRLVVGLITEKSVAELNLLIKEDFTKEKNSLYGLLKKMVEEDAAAEFNKKKDGLLKKVEAVLADQNRKIMKTDLMSSFQVADRVLKGCGQPKKILIILSDMLEDSDAYNFETEILSDERVSHILANEKKRGRIPDLTGVYVYVAGAAASNLDQYYSVMKFWLAYFKESGAIIQKKDYGSVLLSLHE